MKSGAKTKIRSPAICCDRVTDCGAADSAVELFALSQSYSSYVLDINLLLVLLTLRFRARSSLFMFIPPTRTSDVRLCRIGPYEWTGPAIIYCRNADPVVAT